MPSVAIREPSVSQSTPVTLFSPLPVPRRSYRVNLQEEDYPWAALLLNEHYSIDVEEYEALQKIEIIQEFSSKLLTSCKDMDGEIAKIVKENYWDLL